MLRTKAFLPALALVAASLLAGPAPAQEGVLMKQMLGNLGFIPDERDPIDYKERPGLVVPKDLNKLPAPEANGARADAAWPRDPDIAEREAQRRRRSGSFYIAPNEDTANGARMSPAEMAKYRTSRSGSDSAPSNFANDKASVRMSPQEMAAAGKLNNEPVYAPGTEPQRKYLTDPPSGARLPSAAAPMGRGRSESRGFEEERPRDAWKKLQD